MNIDPKKKTILVATQRLMEFQNDASIGKYIDSEKVYLSLFEQIAKAKKINDFNVLLIHPASENKQDIQKF